MEDRIIDTADGKLPKVSTLLIEAMKQDVLADQLLSFQPKAHYEVNERVRLLATRMKKCRKERLKTSSKKL